MSNASILLHFASFPVLDLGLLAPSTPELELRRHPTSQKLHFEDGGSASRSSKPTYQFIFAQHLALCEHVRTREHAWKVTSSRTLKSRK